MKAMIKNFFSKLTAPAETAEKQPKAKNALLQTYFTSLLSLVLCAAMFLGTSYAWFTSEVNNEGNEIYIGILDVGLYRQGETDRLDLSDSANKLFDRNIRWEPGYTSYETVHVVNEGDLAFKYVLSFTDGKLNDQAAQTEQDFSALQAVAKWFDVWVYNDGENTVPAVTAFDQITAADSGWVKAGTLDQMLAGEAVFAGIMEASQVRYTAPEETQPTTQPATSETTQPTTSETTEETIAFNPGTTDGLATEKTYTIALHMQQGADISAMGNKLSLNVKLVAYQLPSEQDALGSPYDQIVVTAGELMQALTNGGTVALAADITLTEGITIPENVISHLDLNGHTIQRHMTTAGNVITNNGTLTISDSAGAAGKIAVIYENAAADSAAVNTIANRGKLTVNGGVISNTCATDGLYQIGYAIDVYNGSELIVNGGHIIASGSNYYDGIRLFCGTKETKLTVNGGKISTIWSQDTSDGANAQIKGSVIVNGGQITKLFYEYGTTVQVKIAENFEIPVEAYGEKKDLATKTENTEAGYIVYGFSN